MQKLAIIFLLALLLPQLHAAKEEVSKAQQKYEKSINAVVQNKYFYKTDRLEFSFDVGVTPYDSISNHVLTGGRLAWHFTDHYGWEILDLQVAFPSLTSFTTGLVQDKGISNLQASQFKMIIGTNLLLSPLYSKVRFFGSTVLYLDIYITAGVGFANVEVIRLSSPGTGLAGVETTQSSSWDPMLNVGMGFKFFLTRAFGLYFDMRNYMLFSDIYGTTAIRSNFAIFGGLNFFIPTFG